MDARKTWKDYYNRVGIYGTEDTYIRAAKWLDGLNVEDWGCGYCFARKFMPNSRYRGIDVGSPLADASVDLALYTSVCQGILLRHVLEHNESWMTILHNAMRSFTDRLCVVLFIPTNDTGSDFSHPDEAHVIAKNLSISRSKLESLLVMQNAKFFSETIPSAGTPYRQETLYYVAKDGTLDA